MDNDTFVVWLVMTPLFCLMGLIILISTQTAIMFSLDFYRAIRIRVKLGKLYDSLNN